MHNTAERNKGLFIPHPLGRGRKAAQAASAGRRMIEPAGVNRSATWYKAIRFLLAGSAGTFAVLAISVAIARTTLPATECVVSEEQIGSLVLESMSYAEVRQRLGCDGVLADVLGEDGVILIETFKWRGDAWPYAVFTGQFIDRVLHGTETYRLDLRISLPHRDATVLQAAGTPQSSQGDNQR